MSRAQASLTGAELHIPAALWGSRTINPASDISDAYFFERYVRQAPEMQAMLHAAGLLRRRSVVDFGGHVGGWAWVMAESGARVSVLDVDDNVLRLGAEFAEHNGLGSITFARISEDTLAALPPSDGVVCVGTLQVMTHAEIRSFLEFVRENLEPGGRLFCNTASPRMLLDWMVRLTRVRSDGVRGQMAWTIPLARGLAQREIARDDRRTYCLRPAALVKTVESFGLRLVRSPRELRRLPVFGEWELSSGYQRPGWVRYYDWYAFERVGRSPRHRTAPDRAPR